MNDPGPLRSAAGGDFMRYVKSPAVTPLRDVIGRLEGAGIAAALGGSGLLAALGLAREVRDWDLTTDAAQADVAAALAGFDQELAGSSGVHADHKVMLPAHSIEVICRFAFHVKGGVVRIPTRVTRRWEELPVGSPEAWAVAYALLDRPAKADLLWNWLGGRTPDREVVDLLLAQPLPPEVRGAARRVHFT
jgi:hypothetical protein